MAELLVFSARQTLGEMIESTPDRFILGSSRQKLKHACEDLQGICGLFAEADSVAKEKMELSREIREVAFELERAVSDLAYGVVMSKFSSWKSAYKSQTRLKIKTLYHCISLLNKAIESVSSKIVSGSSNSAELALRSTYRDVVDDKDLVGSKESTEELVSRLTKEGTDSAGAMVFVSGASGSGKTTVVRKIFEHVEVRNRLESFSWVDACNVGGFRDVCEWILGEIFSGEAKKFTAMREEEIERVLFETLKQNKCLVVFDGVCDVEMWGCRSKFVPDGTRSRIVVITSRTKEVKCIVEQNLSMFEIQPLSDGKSWVLFRERLHFDKYFTNIEDDIEMTKLGHKMVKYCYGLPLAIVALSGLLLATRFKVNDWKKVSNNLKRHRAKFPDDSGLSVVLNLSYDEMPVQLKQCVLHLAQFPENQEVRAKELCQIWIAEEFVPPSKFAESDAYECLGKLVKRCLVQVKKWGSKGRIKTCCVHDVIREFFLSKAQSENFVLVANFRIAGKKDMVKSPTSTCPRLAVYSNGNVESELLPLAQKRDDSLRSFMCFNPAPDPHYEQVLKQLFKSFRMLKVLKFENLARGYVGNLPKEIKTLVLLRFLSLKNSHVSQLPSSIGRLRSLLTLDLRTNWRLKLPVSLSKLTHLRHLYLPSRSSLEGGDKLIFKNFSNLQTLVSISTEYCNIKDLAKLNNLVKLKLHVHEVTDFKKIFEDTKLPFEQLKSLAVENCTKLRMDIEPFIGICPQLCKFQIEGEITKLPKNIPQFQLNLVKIQLKRTRLENDPMRILGQYEKLAILVLDYNAFSGTEAVCSSGDFPRLESLWLVGLERLEEWKVEQEALKNLKYLCINFCYNLKKLPDGLNNIETLKEVAIQRMPRRFKTTFDKEGKELYVLRHITNILPLD